MPRLDFPKSVMEFQRRFATDETCLEYLVESRWPDGFVCPECGVMDSYWLPRRHLFQCKKCKRQTSVTAGSVMHRTRIPLPTWYWAAYLVTTHTPGMSALQFQRQSGIGRYETAFTMLHKLRAAMVREGRDRLRGTVEVDESYVGGQKEGPAGRGAKGKVIVAAAVEVRSREDGKGTYAGRLRLRVTPDVSGRTLCRFVRDVVELGTVVKTDGWSGYNDLKSLGFDHKPEIEGTAKNAAKLFPHVHRVFSNLKSWLIGTHHGVSPQHLPAYLNEYVFRFNRRGTPMAAFQTVLGLVDERIGPTRKGLYGIAKGQRDAWKHPAAV
jgi:transposase-like protein